MSTVVAVAGGTAGLGRAIAEAIKADGRYEVIILSRNENAAVEKASGIRVLAANYADQEALLKLLEDNKISTIVATLNSGMDTTPEMNLLNAAEKSKVTRRYIPNLWSAMVYQPEHLEVFPMAALRFKVMDALKDTSLEWTAIYPGLFLDYFVPSFPSHLTLIPVGVDVEAKKAGIPGDGNKPITFTHSTDIGRFVAALLGLEKWITQYHIAGDIKTWNEVLAISEKGTAAKFDVTYDSIETLEKGEMTFLPGQMAALRMLGGEEMRPLYRGMMSRFGIWMDQGLFKHDGTFLNDIFPEIKPLSIEQAWKKAKE